MAAADAIDRRARGAAVEHAVRLHLLQAGLRELASNASYRGGELDLVMLDDRRLDDRMRDDRRPGKSRSDEVYVVFVEVRYRSHAGFGDGLVSVDQGKRRRLVRAAQLFLASHRELRDAPCRFDVIAADGDPQAPRLTWIRDAFRADDV